MNLTNFVCIKLRFARKFVKNILTISEQIAANIFFCFSARSFRSIHKPQDWMHRLRTQTAAKLFTTWKDINRLSTGENALHTCEWYSERAYLYYAIQKLCGKLVKGCEDFISFRILILKTLCARFELHISPELH